MDLNDRRQKAPLRSRLVVVVDADIAHIDGGLGDGPSLLLHHVVAGGALRVGVAVKMEETEGVPRRQLAQRPAVRPRGVPP